MAQELQELKAVHCCHLLFLGSSIAATSATLPLAYHQNEMKMKEGNGVEEEMWRKKKCGGEQRSFSSPHPWQRQFPCLSAASVTFINRLFLRLVVA